MHFMIQVNIQTFLPFTAFNFCASLREYNNMYQKTKGEKLLHARKVDKSLPSMSRLSISRCKIEEKKYIHEKESLAAADACNRERANGEFARSAIILRRDP